MLELVGIAAALAFLGGLPVAGPGAVLVADAAFRGLPGRAVWIGLGVAVAEALWAGLAYLGAGAVIAQVPGVRSAAHVVGGVLLLGLAGHLWRSAPGGRPSDQPRGGWSFLLGFSVVAPNPTLLVTWGAVSAGVVAAGYGRPGVAAAGAFAAGVGIGAVLAGGAIAALFAWVRGRAGGGAPRWFARGAALLLAALGVAALARAATG